MAETDPAVADPSPSPTSNPTPTGSPPYPQSPIVEKNEAIIVLLINIFVPGIGTIAAGVLGEEPLIGRGIAQLILSIIIIGWIWSIITGIQVLQNAVWADNPRSGA